MISIEALQAALPGSASLQARAAAALAGGASHDSWRLEPFAPAFVSAKGPYKVDVDGRQYIDLWMGHGSLLLGHGDAEVISAVQMQIADGTHLGGLTPGMIAWAEAIQGLVPCADVVRFTASGSEASHLAFRVARAWTGRPMIVRLGGHYHGWHENLLAGVIDPMAIGQVDEAAIEVMDADAEDELAQRLQAADVAAVLLEPGGGGSGALGWSIESLLRLRRVCDETGTLLVFDEVISGFRYAPGGVQALSGVTPDLTMLAKIMAGGFPGGALVGRAGPMSVFGAGVERPHGRARVIHAGTFNAFAPSAAAGSVTLARIADGAAQVRAEVAAQALCDGVNAAAAARGIDAGLYRNSSTVHLLLGWQAANVALAPSAEAFQLIAAQQTAHSDLRRRLLVSGLDMHASHGWLSAAHDNVAIDQAINAFDRVFDELLKTGEMPSAARPCLEECHDPTCAVRRRSFAGCTLKLRGMSK